MPELVLHTVNAQAISFQDELAVSPTLFATVDAVHVATKYVYVTVPTSAKPLRFALEDQVTVRRSQPTEAEKAAQRLEYQLQAIDRAEQSAQAGLAEAQAKMISDLQQNYVITYSRSGDLFMAQAVAALWHRVTRTAQSAASHAVDFDEATGTWSVKDAYDDGSPVFTRLDALNDVREEVKTELLEYASYTSRSTSQLSNAIENYEREAKAKFITRRGYWMY